MANVVLALIATGLAIYAAIDCLRSTESGVRGMPKALWLVVIVFLPLFGPVLWILYGRSPAQGEHSRQAPRTIAPDDDPDFLRSLRKGIPPSASDRDPDGDDLPPR